MFQIDAIPRQNVGQIAKGPDHSIWFASGTWHPAPPSGTPVGGDIFLIASTATAPVNTGKIGTICAPLDGEKTWIGANDGRSWLYDHASGKLDINNLPQRGAYDITSNALGEVYATNVPYGDPPGPNLYKYSRTSGNWEAIPGEGWNLAADTNGRIFTIYKNNKIDFWGGLAINHSGNVTQTGRFAFDVDIGIDNSVWILEVRENGAKSQVMMSKNGIDGWVEKSGLLSNAVSLCAFTENACAVVYQSKVVDIFS